MAADPGFLAGIPLFGSMDDEERAAVAAVMDEARFEAGQVICRESAPGSSCHVIVSGEVEVSVQDDEGKKVVIDVLQPGELFGELSLIDGGTRTATVSAVGPASTLVLERQDLLDLLARRPHMALDVMTALVRRIRHTDVLLRQRVSKNPNEVFEQQETFGERVADSVARFGGSWPFIFSFAGVLLAWVVLNTVALRDGAFDPFPFILLNLFLSMLAAIQAPIIMMSQNRQDAKDRIHGELDYQVNLKAEFGVSELLHRVSGIEEALTDIQKRLPPGHPPADG
jgi:uncharacterized membrane protein